MEIIKDSYETWKMGENSWGLVVTRSLVRMNRVNRLLARYPAGSLTEADQPIFLNLTTDQIMKVLRTCLNYKA